MREVRFAPAFASWRDAVRPLLAARVPPRQVIWTPFDAAAQGALPGLVADETVDRAAPVPRIPAAFVPLATKAACHRDLARWALLYRVAYRLTGGERHLLEDLTDPDVSRLNSLAAAVARDVHRMHAFVRFRRVADPGGERYVAWHRPDHLVVELAAPFFAERFNALRWSILTPDRSAHWDGCTLSFNAGVPRSAAPADDELERLWTTYYASVFNPARLNLAAQRRELPRRHWATLPEASLIGPLARAAATVVQSMVDEVPASAAAFIPARADLPALAAAARTCRGCPLYAPATQTVFGRGPATARVMLVGEQPGDQEDLGGLPFVGPAGAVLDRALEAVGLDRAQLYLTNAVKHFKFEPRGKLRIHQRPKGRDVQACKPWLLAEIDRLRPAVLVALGSTAAQALFGPSVRTMRDRGRPLASPLAPYCLITYHPSAVLRATDSTSAVQIENDLRDDLALAAAALATAAAPARPPSPPCPPSSAG